MTAILSGTTVGSSSSDMKYPVGGADRGRAVRIAAPTFGVRGLVSCASFAAVLASILAGRVASAEEQRPIAEAIEVAPHECLDASRLTPDVARALGRETLDRRVSVAVASEATGVKITVRYAGADRGVRHIKHEPRCSDYVSIVAITVAMAIEALVPHDTVPASVDAGTDAEDAAAPEAGAPSQAPFRRPPPHAGAPSPPRPISRLVVRPSLRGYVESVSNIVPGQAWSFGTALTLRTNERGPRWRLGMGVLFPTDIAIASSAVEASALFVDAAGCIAPLRTVKMLRVCAGVYLGAVSARGMTPPFARASRLPFVHAHGGLEIVVPVRHGFGWLLGADILVGLVRPELVVKDRGEQVLSTQISPPVGWSVRLGVEWSE